MDRENHGIRSSLDHQGTSFKFHANHYFIVYESYWEVILLMSNLKFSAICSKAIKPVVSNIRPNADILPITGLKIIKIGLDIGSEIRLFTPIVRFWLKSSPSNRVLSKWTYHPSVYIIFLYFIYRCLTKVSHLNADWGLRWHKWF